MENASNGGAGVSGAAGGSAQVPPSTDTQTSSDTGAATQARSPESQTADEPEWEFSNGKKFKRSVAEKRIADFEKGFHKTAQARAELAKKNEALGKALSKFGISVEEFLKDPDAHFTRASQEYIARQVEESMMDPKQRELSAKERELAEREAKQKQWDEQRQAEEKAARAEQRANQIAESMAPALAQVGLPANAKTVARMAEVMSAAYRKGIRLDPVEAAEYTAENIRQEQEWHLGQYNDAESLVAALGPQRLEMVRQHLLAQVKKPQAQPRPAPQPPRAPDGKYLGWSEYQKTRRI